MKNYYSIGLITLLLITLIVALVATNFISADGITYNSATAGVMIAQQTTPTPLLINTSEIGSTDGILVMGVVIVLIVTLPLLFRKK